MNYTFFIVVGIAIGLIIIFSIVYYLLPNDSFHIVHDSEKRKLTYPDALLVSVSNQTLLGLGDITPVHGVAVASTIVQSMSTLVILLFFTIGGFKKAT